MELAWNIFPVCATTAPGVRKENISLDEVLTPISEQISLLDDFNYSGDEDTP